jgi:hypothetical protein
MYTPNRYLSLNASFMSVDPSGSINIHDPRTFNQYAYVAGNPLRFTDPAGLAAWDIVNQWNEDYINKYRQFVASRASAYEGKFTCEDFALSLVIDFAFNNNLPLKIATGAGVFDAASDQFQTMTEFKHEVLFHTGARDLQDYNTIAEPLSEVKPGDLLLNRTETGRAHHVQVVTSAKDGVIDISQGNYPRWNIFGFGSGDPFSPLYLGTDVQEGRYYLTAGHFFVGQNQTPRYENAVGVLRLEARTWNFMGWNQ